MDPLIRRFGLRFRISRGHALLVLLIGALIAAAFWIGPQPAPPAQLQLLALTAEDKYAAEVTFDVTTAARSRTPGSSVRFPLVLGVHNVGESRARPVLLYLSVPASFRLLDGSGSPLPIQRTAGNPLVRHRLELVPESIEPGGSARVLGPADTLWLEPALPDYYCTLTSEHIPEFVPAPAYDAGSLSRVDIFYSFQVRSKARQSGLLALNIDPTLLVMDRPPMPTYFETSHHEPAAPLPELGPLVLAGSRTENCGDADQSSELHSVLWETAEGGRFFVVYHDGAPRKYLFDLDQDGVIEREVWDAEGDGRFTASRETRFRTPSLLLPIPSYAEVLAAEEVAPPDSTWLANFHDVGAGPFRFMSASRDTFSVARADAPQPIRGAPGRADDARRVDDPRPVTPPAAVDRPDTTPAPARRAPADTTRREPPRIFGQPVTPPQVDTPPQPRRIFGMPVRERADTVRPDTVRRDTLRRN